MASASGCSGPPTKRLKQTLLSFALSATGAGPVENATELKSVSKVDIRPCGNVQTVQAEVHNIEGLEKGHMNTTSLTTTTTSVKKPDVW